MPRYTMCPYYIDESRKTISCEDVCRSYDSMKKKWRWMDMYCDSWDWMRCPYAADRAEAYRKLEEGDKMALEKQEADAAKKEIESLLRKLGRANKKLDKLRAKNQDLEAQKKIFYEKWRKAEDQLDQYEKKIAGQIQVLADSYESRLAYMMDMYSGGTLNESDVKEWLEGKEWAIVSNEYGYEVVFQEEESDENTQKQEQVQE